MSKKSLPIILVGLFILLLPLTTLAQTEGIPMQKDVFLESIPIPQSAIRDHMDLPDQVTFNLYDSKDALAPIGTRPSPQSPLLHQRRR